MQGISKPQNSKENHHIVVIGTLDTKGDQIKYLCKKIKEANCKTIVIDVGVLGKPNFKATISKEEVAKAANTSINEIIAANSENEAINMMSIGAEKITKDLIKKSQINGVIALGGSTASSLALNVMNSLPLLLPKVVLSTMSNSPALDPDLLCNNMIMVPWIGGIWGINELVKRVLDQAASIITSSAKSFNNNKITNKTHVAISSLGMSGSEFLNHLKPKLKERNCEIAVFHPTGMNTRALEKAIAERMFDIVLELRVACEIINGQIGSPFGPNANRLEIAGKMAIPQIISASGIEVIFWPPHKKIPRKLYNRPYFKHNPLLWVFATTYNEKVKAAKLMARKLNLSLGPTALIMANKPRINHIRTGIHDPEGLIAFKETLRENLKSHIDFIEIEACYDDREFSDEVIKIFDTFVNV